MIRAIIIGLLASAATVTAEIGARQLLVLREEHAAASPQRETEARKTHEINVPRIKDGAVKGYAVMLLSYTVDLNALRTAAMAPDSILVDEAFRYVYNDDTIDFDHMDRFDFATMGKALIRAVNTRVKGDVLVDVGVQEFTYAPISFRPMTTRDLLRRFLAQNPLFCLAFADPTHTYRDIGGHPKTGGFGHPWETGVTHGKDFDTGLPQFVEAARQTV